MFSVKKQYLLASCFALVSSSIFANSLPAHIDNFPLSVAKVKGAIEVDGVIDEALWQQATKVNINNVSRPHDNIVSPVKTEALLMADDENLYVAFIAEDPDTSQIRAYLRDRDRAWPDDTVGFKLDTFNDQRTAYRFFSNPLGAQIDGIESEVTKKESDAWDGIWDSAGKINENGYVVEFALPFRILNFNENLSEQTWGIELIRNYPRDERLRLSNVYLDRNNNCEICQLITVDGFKNIKQGDNLTITPAIVAGANEIKEDEQWTRENNTEVSLDVRWGITPDILLNATINPDFSTVETDNAQLNINNTFALFFAEKRPFFLDNADYFDSNYNLVYTRNINAPNAGAKLTARKDDHSLGLFITDDQSTNILIPGNRASSVASLETESKAAALRYRYNYNEDITLGWVSTLRTADDYNNNVHGIDARFRLSTYDVIKFQSLYSNTEYSDDIVAQFCDEEDISSCTPTEQTTCDFGDCDYSEQLMRVNNQGPFSGNAFRIGYYHNDSQNFFRVTYDKQNDGFRGDLGFISQVDYNKFTIGGDHKWYAEPGQWWTKVKVYSDWDITHNDEGELIEKEFDINAQLNAKLNSHVRVAFSHRDLVGKRWNAASLAIDGNSTLFTEKEYSINGNIKPILGLRLGANYSFGDKIDFSNNRLGKRKRFTSSIDWNANRHLEFKLRQTLSHLDADGANVFIARLLDARATYQFDIQSFLRVSFIYNNTTRNPDNYLYADPEDISKHSKGLSTELLYAYKINPQTVFYLGYSDRRDAEEDFRDLEQNQRSVFMKFSYAWMK